jgi:hypothetical protein
MVIYEKQRADREGDVDIHIHILGNMAQPLTGQAACRLRVMMEREPSLVDFNPLAHFCAPKSQRL